MHGVYDILRRRLQVEVLSKRIPVEALPNRLERSIALVETGLGKGQAQLVGHMPRWPPIGEANAPVEMVAALLNWAKR